MAVGLHENCKHHARLQLRHWGFRASLRWNATPHWEQTTYKAQYALRIEISKTFQACTSTFLSYESVRDRVGTWSEFWFIRLPRIASNGVFVRGILVDVALVFLGVRVEVNGISKIRISFPKVERISSESCDYKKWIVVGEFRGRLITHYHLPVPLILMVVPPLVEP